MQDKKTSDKNTKKNQIITKKKKTTYQIYLMNHQWPPDKPSVNGY